MSIRCAALCLLAALLVIHPAPGFAGGPDFKAKMQKLAKSTRNNFTSTNLFCPGGDYWYSMDFSIWGTVSGDADDARERYRKAADDAVQAELEKRKPNVLPKDTARQATSSTTKEVASEATLANDDAKVELKPILSWEEERHIRNLAYGKAINEDWEKAWFSIYGNCGEIVRWHYYKFFTEETGFKMMVVGWSDDKETFVNDSHSFMLIICDNEETGKPEMYALDSWIHGGQVVGPMVFVTEDGQTFVRNADGTAHPDYTRGITQHGGWTQAGGGS